MYSTEKAVEVALEGMQCLGGNGYINGEYSIRTISDSLLNWCIDYPLGRIVRDSRLYTVGAGSQEIRRMLIGREFNQEFKDQAPQ